MVEISHQIGALKQAASCAAPGPGGWGEQLAHKDRAPLGDSFCIRTDLVLMERSIRITFKDVVFGIGPIDPR
jgi:hypothetical protein